MSGVPFHDTRIGREFFDRTMPGVLAQLAALNTTLARIAQTLEGRSGAAGGPSDSNEGWLYERSDEGWEIRDENGLLVALVPDVQHEREADARRLAGAGTQTVCAGRGATP